MDELRTTANLVATQIKPIAGVTTLKVEPQVLVPQISVNMRPEAASQFNLTPGALYAQCHNLGQWNAGR